jgi:hypothetical protein
LSSLFLKIYWETADGAIPSNFAEVACDFPLFISLIARLSLIAGTISDTYF